MIQFFGAITQTRRHPELVSGSIATHGWRYRFETQTHREVVPVRVVGFNQVDLPVAVPVFQLLFARDGRRHVSEEFVTDKPINGVARRETFDRASAMLVEARDQVGRHADVERTVMLAGEDVDAGLFGHRFSQIESVELASRWTLKQVQGDGGWV
jgi:hypothetical protein